MARPDAERAAEEEGEDAQPGVGTDPARTPQEEGKHKKQVAPDEEKVEEAEQERAEGDESPEERAARIKSA